MNTFLTFLFCIFGSKPCVIFSVTCLKKNYLPMTSGSNQSPPFQHSAQEKRKGKRKRTPSTALPQMKCTPVVQRCIKIVLSNWSPRPQWELCLTGWILSGPVANDWYLPSPPPPHPRAATWPEPSRSSWAPGSACSSPSARTERL